MVNNQIYSQNKTNSQNYLNMNLQAALLHVYLLVVPIGASTDCFQSLTSFSDCVVQVFRGSVVQVFRGSNPAQTIVECFVDDVERLLQVVRTEDLGECSEEYFETLGSTSEDVVGMVFRTNNEQEIKDQLSCLVGTVQDIKFLYDTTKLVGRGVTKVNIYSYLTSCFIFDTIEQQYLNIGISRAPKVLKLGGAVLTAVVFCTLCAV